MKPSVLFVCVHNAGRSQMAAGYLPTLASGTHPHLRRMGEDSGLTIRRVGTIPPEKSGKYRYVVSRVEAGAP